MLTVLPSIDPNVADLTSGIRPFSVEVSDIVNPGVAAEELSRACQSLTTGWAAWAAGYLLVWGACSEGVRTRPS